MYRKPVGLETIPLLLCLAFFNNTRPGDVKLIAGGKILTEGALLDSDKSSYRGRSDLHLPSRNPRRGVGIGASKSKALDTLCKRSLQLVARPRGRYSGRVSGARYRSGVNMIERNYGPGGVGKGLEGLLTVEKGKGEEMGLRLAAIAGPGSVQ